MAEADDRNRARMYLEKAEAFLLAAQNEEDNRLWITGGRDGDPRRHKRKGRHRNRVDRSNGEIR